jgi:hypothetical protein
VLNSRNGSQRVSTVITKFLLQILLGVYGFLRYLDVQLA